MGDVLRSKNAVASREGVRCVVDKDMSVCRIPPTAAH